METKMSEFLDAPGGRVMLLQCAIEEMQDGMGPLSQNRAFIEAVMCALDTAGVFTPERLHTRMERVHEKVARGEPPFDRPFFLADPDAPEDWKKVMVWPVAAFDRAMDAMDKGVFLPPQ